LLKHSYLKISGILKLQKIKELSKIDPKFWKFFTTYKWGIIYMMC
jgi:hypothetical protein